MNRIQLRFGQAVGLKELIATLVVSGILLIVGTVVFSQVRGSMMDLTGAANDTVTNIEDTTYNALNGVPQVGDYLVKIAELSGNPTC
jgi:hypothetical protein